MALTAEQIAEARSEGYTDAEILEHYAKTSGIDLNAARKEGYKDSEILGHIADADVEPQQTLEGPINAGSRLSDPALSGMLGAGAGALYSAKTIPVKAARALGSAITSRIPTPTPTAPAPAPSAPSYTTPAGINVQPSPGGMHPGAVGNAQFNVEQQQANKLHQNVPPGFEVQGTSRIMTPTNMQQPAAPNTAPRGIGGSILAQKRAEGWPIVREVQQTAKKAAPAIGGAARSVLTSNPAAGAMAGYNLQEAMNRYRAGDTTGAAIGGAGTAASLLPKMKGKAGLIKPVVGLGAAALNKLRGEPEGYADGGVIQNFSEGNAVKLKGKAGAVQAVGGGLVSLAKKFGYDAEKVAKNYPEVIPPVLATDPKKGTEYLAKQLSPEAIAVQKARKAAQAEIDKGQYSPFFKLEERYHVDPKNYPLPQRTVELTLPKKEATVATHRAKATDPEAIRRLNEAYDRAASHPGAHDFYAMGQLEDAFIKELGPEAGRAAFKSRFADPLAATTGGADPNSNLMTAAYTNFMRQKGEALPEATHQLPFPIGGRFIAGNIEQAKKYHELGQLDPVSNPKRYNFSSNFQGHLERPTIDEQMMNLFDPKGPKAPQWYGINEQVVNDLAEQRGVTPVNFQEVAWAGGKNYEGKPMMQEINEMLHRTSRITGEPQEEVLKGFIHGNKPMYGIGAGGVGLGATSQDDVPQMAEGSRVVRGGLSHVPEKAVKPTLRQQAAELYENPMVQLGLGATRIGNPMFAGQMLGDLSRGNYENVADTAGMMSGMGLAQKLARIPVPKTAAAGPLGALISALAPNETAPRELDEMPGRQGNSPLLGSGSVMENYVPHMAGGGSTFKNIMADVVEPFLAKSSKYEKPGMAADIVPGAPHTYPPQVPAGTQWMRDYQPQARPTPKITYMGKWSPNYGEKLAAGLREQDAATGRLLDQKRISYLQRIADPNTPGQTLEDLMAQYPRWEDWMR